MKASFNEDPNVEHLDRRYRRLCIYEEDMIETVARLKLSMEPANRGKTLESDDFVVIRSVEGYTLEITIKIREAEIIEMYMSKILRYIRRSLTVIKSYHTIKDEKYENMTEEEIAASPTPTLALFIDGELRVFSIRHRDNIVTIEDRKIDLPVNDLLEMVGAENDTEEEEYGASASA